MDFFLLVYSFQCQARLQPRYYLINLSIVIIFYLNIVTYGWRSLLFCFLLSNLVKASLWLHWFEKCFFVSCWKTSQGYLNLQRTDYPPFLATLEFVGNIQRISFTKILQFKIWFDLQFGLLYQLSWAPSYRFCLGSHDPSQVRRISVFIWRVPLQASPSIV